MTTKTPKVELIAEIKKIGYSKKVSRLWTYSRDKLERILNELKGTNGNNGTNGTK